MSENNSSIDIEIPKEEKRRKRLRALKEKKITVLLNAFNVIVICSVFIFGFAYLMCLERETVSEEENRKLATFPDFSVSSYLKGEYTVGIAEYFDDTVHNRSKIKAFISSRLLPLKGRQYGSGDSGIILYGTAYGNEEDTPTPAQPVTTAPVTTSVTDNYTGTTAVQTTVTTTAVTTIPDNENPAAEGEISDGIVIVNNRGVMLFGGGKANGLEYAASLNAYKEELGEDVNVYSMVCPTPVSYYLPENYQDMTASEEGNIENINSALVNVTPVDAFTALLFHKDEAIYCRTDHHWQPLGAYYAAEEFARVADVPFAPLEDYNKITLEGFVGTLYGYTKSSVLLDNPEDFIYYEPKTEVEVTRYDSSFSNPSENCSLLLNPANMSNSGYYMVFGGDTQITHIKTSCDNGRTLVVFKDSYGNALAPVLTSSFENIYMCDIRYFDLNAISFIKDVGATDVLFAMCTYSAVGVNHDHIEANRVK